VPDTTNLLSQVYLKLDEQDVPEELMTNLQELTVENSLHLPDVATLSLGDPRGQWVDDDRLSPGKVLKIEAKLTQDQDRRALFEGEIVELEPEYVPGRRRLVVRAFDRLHRLSRGRHVRSFQNVTDGDLVQRIAHELRLDVQVGQTNQVHAYVLQDNETNLDFLRERASRLGYLLFVRGNTLHFEEPKKESGVVGLKWGETLGEFHPRLTTIGQTDSATVRGWDPATRQEIVGQARNGRGTPQRSNDDRGGGEISHSAFNMAAETLVTDRAIRTQAEADQLAQAVMDRAAGRFIEAEGLGTGNPLIAAGASVSVKGLGKRFDGTYFVTAATHTYSHTEGYSTRFVISGHRATTLMALLQPASGAAEGDRVAGLVIGIVTDNADSEGQGRVKVKYPSLSGEHASDWARIVMPGAGAGRGLQFIPEVNDEVLVGFEHGDVHQPYILGGLWNGQDAPPKRSDQVVSGGKVQQRIIRSRLGHTITLDDSDDQPSITIVDKTGNNTIKLESSNNKLSVSMEGDLSLVAKGTVTIKGKSVQLEASDDFKATGMSANVEASNALTLKGTTADLEGSATTTVKGGSVSIN
jgi:phage protein D